MVLYILCVCVWVGVVGVGYFVVFYLILNYFIDEARTRFFADFVGFWIN